VKRIIDTYIKRPANERVFASHGIRLSADEERRRFVIQSLLQAEGLALDAYARRFDSDPFEDLPLLRDLVEHHLARLEGFRLALTPEGLERSDAIGPALVSPVSGQLMSEYVLA
jgi:oxygen-independent coproporphyrinogen-3 oxidase